MLNEIWEADWRFTNLLCTQQKLISRERVGAKVRSTAVSRRARSATTTPEAPYQRALAAGVLSPARKQP